MTDTYGQLPAEHPGMNHGENAAHEAKMTSGAHRHDGGHASMIADFRRRFWVSVALTIPILVPPLNQLLNITELNILQNAFLYWALSSGVYFYGGYPFLKGFFDEMKKVRPAMMTLIALAITTAYVYSSAVVFGLRGEPFFWELATLVDIMLLGHWIEMRSIMGASRALEELARLMPSEAHMLMPDGSIMEMPLEQLNIGDRVLVKPGEKIPADGSVMDGESSVNEAMLTGESTPVLKQRSSRVIGGSINGEGSLTVEVQKTGKDSYLSLVIELVKNAQESKSRTQDLADRAALWLTVTALSVGAITFLVWMFVFNRDGVFALERMVSVLVIACPHALGMAVPLVVAVSTSISAKNGLLIRDRAAFEQARKIQAILFDKTGTLTQGKFGVTDTIVFDSAMNETELLKYTASVELHSEHPIAKGIVAAAGETFPIEGFKAIPGKGAEAVVNGREVKVVSPGYLKEHGITMTDERIDGLAAQGKTVVFVLIDGETAGAVALADIIRPESKEAIARLKEMGIRCLMITGDNSRVAKWVADETGIDEYFAEVLPERKAEKVKEVQSRGLIVAMVGDGVNDAPALAQADVGIAVGAGTDVAVATADIILVRSNPLDTVAILGLARATYRKMAQNLGWATGYNLFAIPAAAGVLAGTGILLTPAVGAIFMSLSTVIVSINATLLKVKR
ncbi:MAG: copper-translocating P-type ATPase [Dehalococcoidales bacterium]|nr:copper-translocating P-type ATPase [Dehalococcoidales bacterium]